MPEEERDALIDEQLEKVGKTIAKVANGFAKFLGEAVEKVSPFIMELLTNVLSKLAESYANKVLRKNGINV